MKTVVISGADRNIGLELARQFLKRGWQVFAGRFAENLTLLDELKAEFPSLLEIIPMDVSSNESMQHAAELVAQKTDTVDILLHNAANFGPKDVGKMTETIDLSRFSVPYNINSLGGIRMVQAFLPLMQKGMKRLCFISSEAGAVSVAARFEVSSYCMSKTALNMAIRLMFNELQPKGYSFRLYHPGWVRSTIEGVHGTGGKFDPWETAESAMPHFLEDTDWEDRMVIIDNEGAAWPF